MAMLQAAYLAPLSRAEPHHFDIARRARGLWSVADRDGLIGGTFRTRKDAVRFAMFETDGNKACIHFRRSRR
jgi:hypothetical protein